MNIERYIGLVCMLAVMVGSVCCRTGDGSKVWREIRSADRTQTNTRLEGTPLSRQRLRTSSSSLAGGGGGDEDNVVEINNEETSGDIHEDTHSLKQLVMNKAFRRKGVSEYCDELVTNEEFYIHSPGYPGNYPPNTTCKYQIYRHHPSVCGVVFTVLRLDLAIDLNSSHNQTHHLNGVDSFYRRDGCPGDSLIIDDVVYCGRYQRGKTATFSFASPLMEVRFRSGAGHGASGFLLQGRQVTTCRQPRSLGPPLMSSIPCNRRVEEETFILRSPGYPQQYSHNLECRYTVVRSSPDVCEVQLLVQVFTVEDGSCMFDYLEVQGQRLCGTLPPGFTRHFDFEDDEITIRFRSDESTKRSGFLIRGQQIQCTDQPSVQSPLSQSPPGKTTGNIPFFTTSLTTTRSVLTDNHTDSNINYILSVLHQRPDKEERGDRIEGRNISEEDFTDGDFGQVTTFTEPDDDHTSADQNIPGSVDFNPFTGEGLTPTAPTDLPSDFPTVLTNFPTTNFPTDFPTTVGFPSTDTFPTFAEGDCDQLITSITSDINSPNYPNNYPVSVRCAYVVGRASVDVCRLQINFLDVDLPSQDPVTNACTGDYVDVNGDKFCGTFQNRIVTVNFPDQTITLSFFSDATVTGRGFQIRMTQLTDGCGGPVLPPLPPGQCDATTRQPGFILLSPGYPVRYPPSTDCTTTVLRSSADVNSLVLDLVDFELGTTVGCSGDYLEVGGQRLCGLLSGQKRTVPFVGDSIIIRFHSEADLGVGGRGYRIRVSQSSSPPIPGGCGGVVTTPVASLQSPNYPEFYPSNIDCRYVVNKISNDICQLQLKVLDMDIENGVGCGRDYLQIGQQERLCGRRIPGEIRKYQFSESTLNILFHSDVFGSGRGFSIEIRQLRCGHFKPMHPYYPNHRPHYHHHHYGHHHHHHNHRPTKPFFNHHRPWWKHNPHWRPHFSGHRYTSSYTQQTTPCPYYPSVTPQWSHTTPYTPTTPSPTFPPPTTLPTFPTLIPSSTLPTLPTVTPVFLNPRPIPAVDGSSLPLNGTNEEREREAKRVPGHQSNRKQCQQVVNLNRFTLQSPGYPAPYYTNAHCFYSIIRQSNVMCGVELVVREFDIERSPGCRKAYLQVAGQKYCGSLNHGLKSIIPFNGTQPIVLEFVGGQHSNGMGFSLAGRQFSCSQTEGTDLKTAEVLEQRSRSPGIGGDKSNKDTRGGLRDSLEPDAGWLEDLIEDGDMVLHWIGPGGPNGPHLPHIPS